MLYSLEDYDNIQKVLWIRVEGKKISCRATTESRIIHHLCRSDPKSLSSSIVIFLLSSSVPLQCIFISTATTSSTDRAPMGNPSISLRFTIFLSLSLSVTPFALSPNYHKRSSPPPSQSPIPRATPSDLLNLLGSKPQASAVNPSVAQELKSCLKFLVPFHPSSRRRSLRSNRFSGRIRSRRDEDELVWWPPESVLELARLAVDSGGDPGAIHRALDPAVIPVSVISFLIRTFC